MLNYIALDFETANRYLGSPCSIGLVKVRDGAVVSREHWLMRPPVGHDEFSSFNIGIHGITPEMVVDAPRFTDLLGDLTAYIGDDIVVAHNAVFDMGVIRSACDADGTPWPNVRFLCSLVLARRAISLPSYKLPLVTAACGVTMTNHHHALADAEAVVTIINRLAEQAGADSLEGLASAHGVSIGRMGGGAYAGSKSRVGYRRARTELE